MTSHCRKQGDPDYFHKQRNNPNRLPISTLATVSGTDSFDATALVGISDRGALVEARATTSSTRGPTASLLATTPLGGVRRVPQDASLTILMTDYPGPQQVVVDRLLAALNGHGKARDHRIAMLVLSFLDTRHRRFFYLTPGETTAGLPRLSTPEERNSPLRSWFKRQDRDNVAYERWRWDSTNALLETLWVMGLTIRRPAGMAVPKDFRWSRNVRCSADGASRETVFPCLACGSTQRITIGKIGPSTCPECAFQYALRRNDGTRVAFAISGRSSSQARRKSSRMSNAKSKTTQ